MIWATIAAVLGICTKFPPRWHEMFCGVEFVAYAENYWTIHPWWRSAAHAPKGNCHSNQQGYIQAISCCSVPHPFENNKLLPTPDDSRWTDQPDPSSKQGGVYRAAMVEFSAGISAVAIIVVLLKGLIEGPDHARLNFADLNSQCETLKMNLEAAEEDCAARSLSPAQKQNVDTMLDRCNATLASLRKYLQQGKSLKKNTPPKLQAMYRFSNGKLAEWKEAIQVERINILTIFSMNNSASSARFDEKLDLLTEILISKLSTTQPASSATVHAPDPHQAGKKARWLEARHQLEQKGVLPKSLDQDEDRIISQVASTLHNDSKTDDDPHEDEANEKDSTVRAALLAAAGQSSWDQVLELLESKRNLDVHNPETGLAFSLAVTQHRWNIVEKLVIMGIDPDRKSATNEPAICVAAANHAWPTVMLLAEHGASLDPEKSLEGDPIIIYVAKLERWDTLNLLLDYKANVDVEDREGKRVLAYALTSLLKLWPKLGERERLEIAGVVSRLLRMGAKVGEKELEALMWASSPEEMWHGVLNTEVTVDDLLTLLNGPSLAEDSDLFVN
ncbi:hypothetical protein ASPCAL00906 [Aspergillus calidoustus]|uniref:Uncharacterized protein n=1 Tax=Aspergillus calidoustus TaxID=454130 RepID=A0A0U5FTI8_ASPCI|nr:hypothetical protein ASPCAL00906 [Aspergillus calidoustus]